MDPQKSNLTVLAQIVKQIPAKIIDSLAKKFRIQTRAFSPTSHVVTLLYEHLAHSLSLNDVCDSLQHHAGILSQIRRCTPPARNGLSYANRTRNADMAEELFWYVYNDIISDERIRLTIPKTAELYPKEIRLVTAEVEVKRKMTRMEFITNNFDWSPFTVCELYRARWGIEVFFKEIKQTLQLSDFMGYNENAVRWQIWTGLLAYLLLRFISWEKHWKHTFSRLYTLIRGVLLNFFDLPSIIQCCDTMGRRGPRRIRGAPEQAYQMFFDFA